MAKRSGLNKCKTRRCNNRKSSRGSYCHKCVSRRSKEINPVGYHYNALKQNAKRRGKEFKLSRAEFKAFCEKTNYLENKGKQPHSYSIDRIDNSKGYSVDNIQILTLSENTVKRSRQDYVLKAHHERMGPQEPQKEVSVNQDPTTETTDYEPF